jgi:hypothetical protein
MSVNFFKCSSFDESIVVFYFYWAFQAARHHDQTSCANCKSLLDDVAYGLLWPYAVAQHWLGHTPAHPPFPACRHCGHPTQ